jgi:hypothetical protein
MEHCGVGLVFQLSANSELPRRFTMRKTGVLGIFFFSAALCGCDAAYIGEASVLVRFPRELTKSEIWRIEIWDIRKFDDNRLIAEVSGGGDLIPAVLLRRSISGRSLSDKFTERGPRVYFDDVRLVFETAESRYTFESSGHDCEQAESDTHLYVCDLKLEDLSQIAEESEAIAHERKQTRQ